MAAVSTTQPQDEEDARTRKLADAAGLLASSHFGALTAAEDQETASLEPGNDVGEFASAQIEDAFTASTRWFDSPPSPAVLDLFFTLAPVEDFDFEAFAAHVASLGLKHFQPIEFLYLGASHFAGRCRGKNTLPPKELWGRLDNTARMLDRIRERLNAPIRILSAYRSPPYNSCIGGESGSYHMRFNALDWTCAAGTVEHWRDVARQVRQEDPSFMGGIGFYRAKQFIHIDTRGVEANWVGRA